MQRKTWHPYSKNQQMEQEVWEFNGQHVNVRPAKVKMAKAVFRNDDGSLVLPPNMRCSPGVYWPPEVLQARCERTLKARKILDQRCAAERAAKRKIWNMKNKLRNPYISKKKEKTLDEESQLRLLQSLKDKHVTKETLQRRRKKIEEKYPHLLYK